MLLFQFESIKSQMTVYLDWSHYCDALAAAEQGDTSLRDLINWISREHDLCMSFTHLMELANGGDTERVFKRAEWLDSLRCKWIKSKHDIEPLESEAFLLTQLNGVPSTPSLFASSFLSLFPTWTPENLSKALSDPTVAHFCRNLHKTPAGDGLRERYRGQFLAQVERLASDRRSVIENGQENDLAELKKKRLRAELTENLTAAHNRLATMHESGYMEDSGVLALPPNSESLKNAIGYAEVHPAALPLQSVARFVVSNLADAAARQTTGTGKFEKRHAGDFFDLNHLIGAAYCDVFTCDKRTSSYLGEYRVSVLSRRPQISSETIGLPGLVRAIEEQLIGRG